MATLAGNKDFEALGTLILALEKIAGMDLRQSANQAANMDLQSFLEELRIIVEPSLQEDGIDLQWEIKPGLPMVWADRQSLVQVFLNLTKNAARAMEGRPVRELAIVACAGEARSERQDSRHRLRCQESRAPFSPVSARSAGNWSRLISIAGFHAFLPRGSAL